MSLSVYLTLSRPTTRKAVTTIIDGNEEAEEVYSANITHNLGRMAVQAGIYEALWRPDEIGAKWAGQLIAVLEAGLERLKATPERFRGFDAPNGWGTYEHFVPFVEKYLEACREHPMAVVSVSR